MTLSALKSTTVSKGWALALTAALACGLGVAPANAAPAISWEQCPPEVNNERAECGRIDVPTYYSQPDAGSISVGFVRLRAENPSARLGSLFTNPGGPGGSAYSWVGNTNAAQWPAEILQEWDIIGVQPRGLKGSTPLNCSSDSAQASSVESFTQIGGVTRDACEANTPGYTDSLTTENTARDWEMVRSALGEDKISIAGLSYGTFLGSAYATLYPEHTDKLLLDSGMDPGLAWNGIYASQQAGYENALHDFFGFIARNDATYHLGSTPLQAYERWSQKVAAEAGARPTVLPPNAQIGDLPPGLEFSGQPGANIMTATGPLRVQAENLRDMAAKPGSMQAASPTLAMTREAAPRPEVWDTLAKHIAGIEPIEVPAGSTSEEELKAANEAAVEAMTMQNVLVCNENQVAANPTLLPSFIWSNYVTGDPFTAVNSLYASGAACSGRTAIAAPINVSGSGLAVRPLQIQGTGDPQTPYQFHTGLSQRMNSRVITVHGPGHGHFALGNRGVDEAAIKYLRTGEADVSDLPGLDLVATSPIG